MSFSLPTDEAVFPERANWVSTQYFITLSSAASCELRSLERPNESVYRAHFFFPVETFCSKCHIYCLSQTWRVVVLVKKMGEKHTHTQKKSVTSQKTSIIGAREEIPRCFCFASNHTKKRWEHHLFFSLAGLGFCEGAAFIEILMPPRASLSVLSVNNATWVTSC